MAAVYKAMRIICHHIVKITVPEIRNINGLAMFLKLITLT